MKGPIAFLPTWVKRAFSGTTEEDNSDGLEYPPYIGQDNQLSPEWPQPPEDPTAVIEIRLYWQAEKPWTKRACQQVVPYIEYCLLHAYADDGYDVDVAVHEEPIPSGVDDYDGFTSFYWSSDNMVKDCNLALAAYGNAWGEGGGHGGWVDPRFFEDWNRDPSAPIKNVGGDGDHDGPTFGTIVVLHEIGHCLGLRHTPSDASPMRLWGKERITPMDAGYDDTNETRYAFVLHPSVRENPPDM